MRSVDALISFRQHLRSGGLTAGELGARSAVTALLGFYAGERASDADMDADGDMLLFQWGTYDWGPGPAFQYNITRQLITGPGDDEHIWQLGLSVYFRSDEENTRLASGHRWLETPAGLREFASWVAGHPATAYCAGRHPLRTELEWGPV